MAPKRTLATRGFASTNAIATTVTGLLLLVLGLLRLGSVVRFIPFSVVAGFLAASGSLLVGGAVLGPTPVTALDGSGALASKRCSPGSTGACTPSSAWLSRWCRPIVGSSRM